MTNFPDFVIFFRVKERRLRISAVSGRLRKPRVSHKHVTSGYPDTYARMCVYITIYSSAVNLKTKT